MGDARRGGGDDARGVTAMAFFGSSPQAQSSGLILRPISSSSSRAASQRRQMLGVAKLDDGPEEKWQRPSSSDGRTYDIGDAGIGGGGGEGGGGEGEGGEGGSAMAAAERRKSNARRGNMSRKGRDRIMFSAHRGEIGDPYAYK